ncbi:hypothetical protein ACFSTA_16580 [Ornithinibacillus salinisoli]|uniref:ABC transporter permease n=1 Tax=Ornithinibacillus salinisoli TaxID=1848459 RepID=A0ABW4W0F7_9BACI
MLLHNWKQAYSLAKFELKAFERISIISILIYLLVMQFVVVKLLEWHLDSSQVRSEAIFLLIFLAAITFLKPKELQSQPINSNIMASPVLIMQKQLPINEDTMIKSRFIIHFLYTVPFQILILIGLYFLSSLHELLHVGSFIAFIIFWLSLGVLFGNVLIKVEIRRKYSYIRDLLRGIILYFIATTAIIFIRNEFNYGLIDGSIYLTQRWPWLTTLVSVIIAFLCFNLWIRNMKKSLEKTDYM